jgi:hypothetical protein
MKWADGVSTELSAPQSFMVKRMSESALEGSTIDATAAFWRELEDISLQLGETSLALGATKEKLKLMSISLNNSRMAPGDLDKQLHVLDNRLQIMDKQISGDPLRNEVGEKSVQTIGARLWMASNGTSNSTYGPTATHKQSVAIAKKQLTAIQAELTQIVEKEIPALEQAMREAKAPPVKGGAMR